MTSVVETRVQTIWLDDEGIIRATSRVGHELSLEDAKESIVKIALLCAGVRRPIVVDLTGLKAVSRDARKYFAGPDTAKVESAAALVVRSPMARAIGNFFMGFDKGLIPGRLFTSQDEALIWVRQFLP
jgi:hypothetical protein